MIPEELLGKADIPRIIIISVSITGVILLLFNVLLVVCFILRKKKKKIKKGMFRKFVEKTGVRVCARVHIVVRSIKNRRRVIKINSG